MQIRAKTPRSSTAKRTELNPEVSNTSNLFNITNPSAPTRPSLSISEGTSRLSMRNGLNQALLHMKRSNKSQEFGFSYKKEERKFKVDDVIRGSLAYRAGLRKNDIIQEVIFEKSKIQINFPIFKVYFYISR